MTPERWKQVDKLLEQALGRPPDRRAAFLDEACNADTALRQEVESLLSAHGKAGDFVEAPALEVAAPASLGAGGQIAAGQRLGHYQILSLLGTGGMGKVYLAQDTRLGRKVALKLLPGEFTRDQDRVRRFEREARAASALNHPNILTVHEIGRTDGATFMVTEFIEGQTLRQRMSGQRLSLSEALDLATQVSSALVAAHESGIVHRDIKPENVMLRQDGYVKVLDFGLAKLAGAGVGSTTGTRSLLTETGMIMGTARYMSPEQALGQEVDHRTDLFSLGALLYEMAAGRPAFQGDTSMAVLDAILHQQPVPLHQLIDGEGPFSARADFKNLRAARESLPAVQSGAGQQEQVSELQRIIDKALEKDRELRYQTALDLRADLKRLQRDVLLDKGPGIAEPQSNESASLAHPPSRKKPLVYAALAGVLLAVLAVGWHFWQRPKPRPEPTQRQLTTNSFETPVAAAAISPDGKYVAFADENGTYLRLMDTGERHSLAFPANLKVSHLAWFPDGTRLAACGTSREERFPSLWTISILGGAPRKLRDDTLSAAVSSDGAQIAFVSGNGNEIWLMRSNGENAQKTVVGSKEDHFRRLSWFPNGRRLGYIRELIVKQKLAIESCDLKGGSVTVLFSDSWLSDICHLSNGRLLYSIAEQVNRVQSTLWELALNIETGQALGNPVRILAWPGFSVRGLSASQDGKQLTFLKETNQAEIYVGELEENGRRMKAPERLTFDDRYDTPAAWTPDGKAVIFSSDRNGNFDIFKQALGKRSAEPIMAGPEGELDPTVSPDGAWILFFDRHTGFRLNSATPASLKRAPISGGPAKEVLNERGFAHVHCAHRSSGRCVVDQRTENQLGFYSFDPLQGKGQELASIELDPSVRTSYTWQLSPDGSELAIMTAANLGRIRILSLADKSSREVELVAPEWSTFEVDGWSADGKGWFATGHSGVSEALLHIDRQGHASVLWQQPISLGGLWSIPSPDGRYLAFPASTSTGNAWLLENF